MWLYWTSVCCLRQKRPPPKNRKTKTPRISFTIFCRLGRYPDSPPVRGPAWNAGWFGWLVCVKWHSVLEWCQKISKLILPIHKKEWMSQLPRHLFTKPPRKSICQDAAKIIEPKLDDTPVPWQGSPVPPDRGGPDHS